MKKGPLSKKEKRIIEQDYKNHSAATISQKLDRSKHIVEKYIMKMNFEANPPQESGGGTVPKTMSGDLFARNRERGVTIMTKEASMSSDEFKGKRKEAANGTNTSRLSKFIHKIKD
jgi:hypothetical protein